MTASTLAMTDTGAYTAMLNPRSNRPGEKLFIIKDVPAGTYRLRAWHERLPGQVREVVVPAQGQVKVDFVLGVAELPKI